MGGYLHFCKCYFSGRMFIDFQKKIFQIMGLRVFETRVLRYTFEFTGNEVRGGNGEDYITRRITICTQLLLF
jgi:hypothetical protein